MFKLNLSNFLSNKFVDIFITIYNIIYNNYLCSLNSVFLTLLIASDTLLWEKIKQYRLLSINFGVADSVVVLVYD